MSRHKLVKALDLSEELDDFDGGDDSDYDEVGTEDKEQLRIGTIKVRNIIGDDVSVTNKDIEDSLWHYYYDVEKTVNFLLNQKTKSAVKKSKQKKANAVQDNDNAPSDARFPSGYGELIEAPRCSDSFDLCSRAFSAADFFKDSPWLNVPQDRRGEILIEPLYPSMGLLGGASKQENAPKSKLAALAAARRKKDQQKAEDGQHLTKSVALLDKLGVKSKEPSPKSQLSPSILNSRSESIAQADDARRRKYPSRRPQNTDQKAQPSREADAIIITSPANPPTEEPPPSTLAASPSMFAKTLFGPVERRNDRLTQCFDIDAMQSLCTEFDFTGPSPDDTVLAAQNSKIDTPKPNQQKVHTTADKKPTKDITEGVKNVTIGEAEVKRKNLDVLAEFEKSKPKKAANFVVIGHVDAGKSTLMGRLLYDLNVVDKRTVEKYRKEADRLGKSSFALAWVLDQGTEERERGVTIDTAMNTFETENTKFTILDAPGHRDFIPNMIAGATQADFAVLVIDASTGNYESGLRGQTKEHALLVRSIGVQRVVVAVNKLDVVEWSQDRFDEISQQVSAFLTSAGFLLKNLAFVPCAGLTGENIVQKSEDAKSTWYHGPVLISLLESSEPITRALEKDLRLTIDDIFRGGVQNPLSISGRIDAGTIQAGDVIQLMPANQKATIKGLEVDSEHADWAVAGQNVIVHLTDIEAKYLKSGDVICPPTAPIQCITSFTLKILAFEHVTPMHCELHRGRLHLPARVTKLVAQLDKASGAAVKGKKPRIIKPGMVARIILEVDDPIPLEQGGRVILRNNGETVGAGLVE
ncbi:hypothetical protein ACLMJK_007869 [Lecanora helva]